MFNNTPTPMLSDILFGVGFWGGVIAMWVVPICVIQLKWPWQLFSNKD